MRQPDARPVGLDEARTRVGETMRVIPSWRKWTADEIRWLNRQWGLTLPSDEDVAIPLTVWQALAVGAGWWRHDSPRIVRVMTAFAVLFLYAFSWGWFSA